jgi:arylsulfatase A-like enzyme
MSRFRWQGTLVVTALGLWLAACGEGSYASGRRADPEPPRDDGRTSLVLITVDTTRADHLGCYGNPLRITPNIDALAGRATVFESAYAPMPQTLPSHATLFTGLEPRLHGALENTYSLPDHVSTLAELLASEGFATGGFIGAEVLHQRTGIAQGFEHYDGPDAKRYEAVHQVVRRPAKDVTSAALEWAGDLERGQLFLLWAHYYDPHDPFDPPAWAEKQVPREQVATWVESRRHKIRRTKLDQDALVDYWHGYAAEMRYMDEEIGRLLEGLGRNGRLGNAHVILVADHGEGLYEHGERGHGVAVYEELMRVPFMVADPAGRFAGVRLSQAVTLADVFPTALELALARPLAFKVSGTSLAASLRAASEPPVRTVYLERPHYSRERLRERSGKNTPDRYTWGVLAALIEDGFKLIREPGSAAVLYDLRNDPDESKDVSAQEGERLARLQRRLDEWLANHPTPEPGTRADASPEQLEALRALGYLGTSDE